MSEEKALVFPPPEVLLEALELGEWTKGVGELHPEEGKFCCLGVGCVLAGAEPDGLRGIGHPDSAGVEPVWLQSEAPEWMLALANRREVIERGDSVEACFVSFNDYWHGWQTVKAALRRLIREREEAAQDVNEKGDESHE